jgi:hypothetical protein
MPEPDRNDNGRVSVWLDLRTCIAALFAVYGVVCLIWGLVFTDQAELRKSGGIHLNLWAGVGMLVVSAAFVIWAVVRPMAPAPHTAPEEPGTDAPPAS